MSIDEVKLLKLGDYIKRCVSDRSDEYYMVTDLNKEIKLRKVGSSKVIYLENPDDFFKVDTTRNR